MSNPIIAAPPGLVFRNPLGQRFEIVSACQREKGSVAILLRSIEFSTSQVTTDRAILRMLDDGLIVWEDDCG